MARSRKAVVILSGGMDSITLLYKVLRTTARKNVLCLSFNYGQRHVKELDSAREVCKEMGVLWKWVNVSNVFQAYLNTGASSLIDGGLNVPLGEMNADAMKKLNVPLRNVIFVMLAVPYAVEFGASKIYVACHKDDCEFYPDCRPELYTALNRAIRIGLEGLLEEDNDLRIALPFKDYTKADIARVALKLGVPLEKTWSCYVGGKDPCGKCPACVAREKAIKEAKENPELKVKESKEEAVEETANTEADLYKE